MADRILFRRRTLQAREDKRFYDTLIGYWVRFHRVRIGHPYYSRDHTRRMVKVYCGEDSSAIVFITSLDYLESPARPEEQEATGTFVAPN